MQIKDKIRINFSKSAAHYDEYAQMQKQSRDKLLQMVESGDYSSIIDIGCGTGGMALDLAERFPKAKVVGIDLAPGMIAQAVKKNPFSNLIFLDGDGEKLDFDDSTFDLAVSTSAFQWMDPAKCFGEAQRVLKDSSRLYFSMFGHNTLLELKSQFASVDVARHLDRDELLSAMERAGFADILIESRIQKGVFPDLISLLKFLKDLGAQSGEVSLGFSSRKILREIEVGYRKKYGQGDGISATFEVLFGCGRAKK